jgi:hypothetical protein
MKVLLLYNDGEQEAAEDLRPLFSRINAGVDTFSVSSGGDEGELFPALLGRPAGSGDDEQIAIAPTHVVILSTFPSSMFAFLAGFAYGSALPGVVFGDAAISLIPAGFASCFKVLEHKKALIQYLEKEWQDGKKREAAKEVGKARDILLQMGISVTKESMIHCVSSGQHKELSLFLAAGFSPDTQDKEHVPLLHLAARAGHQEILQTLMEAGAQVNLLSGDRGSSALLDAVMGRRRDMAEILLETGADVNLKTKDGQSALIIAVGAGDEACAGLLLKAGADPDDTDALGASARKYATLFHNEAILNLFNTYAPVKAL